MLLFHGSCSTFNAAAYNGLQTCQAAAPTPAQKLQRSRDSSAADFDDFGRSIRQMLLKPGMNLDEGRQGRVIGR
jgi:hypothetical protein